MLMKRVIKLCALPQKPPKRVTLWWWTWWQQKVPRGLTGYQATIQYDTSQLTFSSSSGFAATDLFTGGLPIIQARSGVITAAVAFLGSTTATADSGTLGRVTFTVAEGYSGSTRVTLLSGQFASSAGTSKLTIGTGGAAVQIGGESTDDGGTGGTETATPDLNGNGVVDFPDFIAFASAFGSSEGAANFNAKADLNGNGAIDFPDFLVFAQQFGQPVSSKRASLAKPVGDILGANAETVLSLVSVPTRTENEAVVALRLEDAVDVKGYNLQLNYDTAVLELADVFGPQGSLFGDGVAIQSTTADGAVLLADVLQSDAALSGAQDLMVAAFQRVRPHASWAG